MNNRSVLSAIKSNSHLFHTVIPFDGSKDKLVQLDLTASNHDLKPEILNDAASFSTYINDKIKTSGAKYGIGGYAEHRTVYNISNVFDADKPGEEPRRLHLGTDIWGKPNTPVMAPADGIVHSFAFSNRFGDYGVTIILSHFLEGLSFCTLYGHLSLSSIKNLKEGQRISKGDVFAELGIPAENGGWPPHLHFQIILDMGEWKGDYPGVCKFSERENWLQNSPDPDVILQLNRYIKN